MTPSAPIFDCDYSAIEARIVCWLAGQEDALEEYRQGVDRYCNMAGVIFGMDGTEIRNAYKAGDKDADYKRFIGKQTVLGCGFGLGGEGYKRQLWDKYRVDVPLELANTSVKAFREVHPKVNDYWRVVEKGCMKAIREPGTPVKLGWNCSAFVITTAGMPFLFIKLPSGRNLAYPQPKLKRSKWYCRTCKKWMPPFFDCPKCKAEESITYSIHFLGNIKGEQWGDLSTYGGSLVENITQAVSADITTAGLINCRRKGYEVFMLIHDQILATSRNPKHTLEEFHKLLVDVPSWADGLPVVAESKIQPFYSK